MASVRARGPDIVVRYAGRRLRITSEWCEVSDDALDHLRERAAGALEEKQTAPKSAPPAKKTENKKSSSAKLKLDSGGGEQDTDAAEE